MGALSDGRLQIFGAGGSGIWTTWKETRDANSGWVGWGQFQPLPFGTAGALAVAPLCDGRLQLFAAEAAGGTIYTCWKDNTDPDSP